MPTLLDYLDWRGDLTFDVAPFNELDAALFSQLCLMDLDKAFLDVPEGTLEQIYDAYIENGGIVEDQIGFVITNRPNISLKKMAKSRRYRDLIMHNYFNEVISEISLQFCALQIDIDDKTTTICFSGTDDTLAGWQENAEMILDNPTGAQIRCIEYVKDILDNTDKNAILLGHSKGGNLTLYSACMIPEKYLTRINMAYSFDGPGFTEEEMKKINRNALTKIISYVPQSSVVGRIFFHPENFVICQSTASGVMQHDLYSWELMATEFNRVDSLTDESIYLDYKVKKVVDEMDSSLRVSFISSLFKFLYSTNSETLTDVNKNRTKIVSSYRSLQKEEKKTLSVCLSKFTSDRNIQALAINDILKTNKFRLDDETRKMALEYSKGNFDKED